MELNKENIKKILGILTFGIVLHFILQNISIIKCAVDKLIEVTSPFLFGTALAFILNIPLKLFEKKLFKPKKMKNGKIKNSKIKRPISIFLSFILLTIIISFVIKLVIPEFIRVIYMFVKDLPSFAYDLKEFALDMTDQYPDISKQIQNIEIDWNSISNDIINFTTELAKNIVTSSIGVISSFVGGVFNTVVAIVFSIYILNSKEKLENQAKKIINAYFSKSSANYILNICSISKKTFNNFIAGQFTEAVILGTLCFLGMAILRLPYATTIGVLIGVTALIPIIGAFIGIIIGALLILSVSPIKSVIFIVFLIILQQIETNVIYPKVVGDSVGLPGMWVLFAVAIGGSLFGILGLLLGLPVVSVLYSILKNDVYKRLEFKKENL